MKIEQCENCGEELTDKDMILIRCPYCDEVIDEDPSYEYRGDDMEMYY